MINESRSECVCLSGFYLEDTNCIECPNYCEEECYKDGSNIICECNDLIFNPILYQCEPQCETYE